MFLWLTRSTEEGWRSKVNIILKRVGGKPIVDTNITRVWQPFGDKSFENLEDLLSYLSPNGANWNKPAKMQFVLNSKIDTGFVGRMEKENAFGIPGENPKLKFYVLNSPSYNSESTRKTGFDVNCRLENGSQRNWLIKSN